MRIGSATTATAGQREAWHGLEVISRGAHRLCARDPHDPGKCLKFELDLDQRPQAGLRQNLHRQLALRFPEMGANRTELRAYRSVRARLGSHTDGYLVPCHGMVVTPHGEALQCDCIRTSAGEPAPSLYHCLFSEPRYRAAGLCAAVDAFEAWLIRHDVPLFDLNAGNFVVDAAGGSFRLLCVDSKSIASSKEIVPYSRWSTHLMHGKVARRAKRLRERIRAALRNGSNLH